MRTRYVPGVSMQSLSSFQSVLLLAFFLSTALHVTAQIVWLTKPRHTVVNLGQDLLLDCRAAIEAPSGGQLSFTWLFNLSTVQDKALYMANASLFVPHVTADDEGVYTCVVHFDGREVEVNASAEVVIAYINDFFMPPESTTAPVGSEAVLSCVTGRSAPYPQVYWVVNGKRLDDANTQTATFGEYDPTGLSAQVSMKLMYLVTGERDRTVRCVAVNPLSGEAVRSDPAVVTPETVEVRPQIVSSPLPLTITREFQPLSLDCQAIGYPRPYIYWFKDNDYVDDARAFTLPNGTLYFRRVEEEDAGLYACEARNNVGSVWFNGTSVILASIDLYFVTEPSDITTLAGHPVTLFCTPPHSIPSASVRWYKDYAPVTERSGMFSVTIVENEDERNLHFSSVQEGDEGSYYCVATNNYSLPMSRTSSIAQLTVNGSPVITEPPMNTEVVKGSLLHLTCGVDLETVDGVYWTFLGERLLQSSTVSIGNQGQDLFISNVGKSWEGRYTCTAENSYGQKTLSAIVTVIVPPVTLQELGERSVTISYAILLPCFIYGDPSPAFIWYHDGSLVMEDDRHRLLTTGLYIDPTALADRGHYSCRGNNSAGFAWSNGTLDVTVPPTADLGGSSMTAIVGEPLTLRCHVEGHPSPSVHWLHNGTSEGEEWQVSADNTTLTLSVFSWPSSGRYSCVAINVEDTAMATIVVSAQVKPKVMEIAGRTAVDIGRSLTLTCQVEGVPAPVVTWTHDRQVVQATLDGRVRFPDPYTLNVRLVTPSDAGRYDCLASSPIGNSSRSVSVFIVEPPRPPQLLEATAVSVSSVRLRWQHVFQAPYTDVTAFVIQYRKRTDSSAVDYPERLSHLVTDREVEGLEAGTEYVFTVSAENSAGRGVPSNSLTATTFQSGPPAPDNVRVVSTTSITATVTWEMVSVSRDNVQQYQLQYRAPGDADYSVLSVTSSSSPTQTVRVEGLVPNTHYQLRVRASSEWRGDTLWGTFSSFVSVQTDMAAPSAPPAHVEVTVIDPFSVHVAWQPVPTDQQHGPITRYRVTYRLENVPATLGSMTTNSSQLSLTIRGLSPWTRYSLTVEAENVKGVSPQSDVISFRTDPTAPGSPPQSVTVVALPGRSMRVDWQPVPASSRNSELGVYVVQYRQAGDPAWAELNTEDNQTLSITISDVIPWSWYEVQVAATTTQVSPGQGPFSALVQIHTLQAAAGPVRRVSFNMTANTISLSWEPPLQIHGVLAGYRVDFHPIPLAGHYKRVIMANTTHVELRDLFPDTVYNISVAALNGAGRGNSTVLRLRTTSPPVSATAAQLSEDDANTMEQVAMEMTTAANQTSSPSRQLPVIVASSLIGAAILIILIIVFLCRCYRARRATRAKYLIQGRHLQGYGSGSLYRHMDDTNDIIITNAQLSPPSPAPSSSSASVLSPQQQQQSQQQQQQQRQKDRDRSLQQLGDSSWFGRQAQKMEAGTEAPPVYLPVHGAASDGNTCVILPPSPGGGEVFTVHGIDNPGFSDDKVLLPGLSSDMDMSPEGATADAAGQEGVEQRVSTLSRKRGRMRSESAAAIAVLRSTASTADDTEVLLSNDFSNVHTEVVFKHRTVL